jgi:polysaccharide biosynthesis protein PslL
MPKRIAYIDVAKGIGILLVVLAHNDLQAFAPFLHSVIYAFHMPLFFFLSGLFFKPEISLGDLLRRRLNTLVKPYFFTIFIIYFCALFFSNLNFAVALSRIAKSFYGNGFYLDWVAMWFLPALFMVNLFALGFYRLLGRFASPWPRWIALVVIQVVGVLTLHAFMPFTVQILGKSLILKGLPWSLDLVLVAGFFFILGREVYQHVPQESFSSIWTLLFSTVVGLGLLLLSPATIDLNTRLWENLLINTSEALAGIVFILALSRQIERGPAWLGTVFSYLGRISIIILIFHNPVQSYLTPKIDQLLGGNPYSPLVAYPFAVLVPIVIYELAVRFNPRVSALFGLADKKVA